MPRLTVPAATAAPPEHADWLELEALRAADKNSSSQDLASALRRTGSSEEIEDERPIEGPDDPVADRGGETTEPIVEAALEEVEDRASACAGAYPFAIDGQALQGTRSVRSSLYAFLLLVSRYGKDAAPDGLNAAQLFEEVAEVAIANCMGGARNDVRTVQFGFPRRLAPSGFRNALDDLCRRTGEGIESKARPNRKDQKDAALDLVAWRPFPDERRGMVMAWGQCATGADWRDKLGELHPENWAAAWMAERPAVVPLSAFFVPHRVDRGHWDVSAIKGGLLFDRCRIAAFAHRLPRHVREGCRAYNRHVLAAKV